MAPVWGQEGSAEAEWPPLHLAQGQRGCPVLPLRGVQPSGRWAWSPWLPRSSGQGGTSGAQVLVRVWGEGWGWSHRADCQPWERPCGGGSLAQSLPDPAWGSGCVPGSGASKAAFVPFPTGHWLECGAWRDSPLRPA